jgi:deleted-in-malignant-brain-tumors protein 1
MLSRTLCNCVAFVCVVADTQKHAATKLRIVDSAGTLVNVGLLQVQTEEGLGSVCGLNDEASNIACRSLGYDYGVVGSAPCASYGGQNLCGATGSGVAMKNLQCRGDEVDINGCVWEQPDGECLKHTADAIVFCSREGDQLFEDGSVRLVASDGAPSLDGKGRLEVARHGEWESVCSDGFTQGSALIACKQLGFGGATKPSILPTCDSNGGNVCSSTPGISRLACSGAEKSLLSCSFDSGDEVFCAKKESVILSCDGA